MGGGCCSRRGRPRILLCGIAGWGYSVRAKGTAEGKGRREGKAQFSCRPSSRADQGPQQPSACYARAAECPAGRAKKDAAVPGGSSHHAAGEAISSYSVNGPSSFCANDGCLPEQRVCLWLLPPEATCSTSASTSRGGGRRGGDIAYGERHFGPRGASVVQSADITGQPPATGWRSSSGSGHFGLDIITRGGRERKTAKRVGGEKRELLPSGHPECLQENETRIASSIKPCRRCCLRLLGGSVPGTMWRLRMPKWGL